VNAWRETVLDFPDAGLAIDLRIHLDDHLRAALHAAGLAGTFAVVTACNPRGVVLASGANLERERRFGRWVRSNAPGSVRVIGRSPDGRHAEPGWGLPIRLEEARRLAATWEQEAIFWFDGGRFWIEPALADGPAVALPPPAVTP